MLMMVLESCVATQSCEQKGTKHAPLRVPVLRVSMADVVLPTLTTWGRPFRKSRIQLQREVLVPGFLA